MILRYDKNKEEISELDLNRMSEKTKVLLYCIISYNHLDALFDLVNLHDLKDCSPLS